jgi:DNA-binding GntR family transcriptional regulator
MVELIIRNLSDQLVDIVRCRILDGTVPPDQVIRQDALAAELGVSKIPLREALSRLEQEGLVRNVTNRGYFVCPLDAAEAEEVYALRLKLEPELVARAAVCATDQDREQAIATHAALLKATAAREDVVGSFNRAFHLALIRPSRRLMTISLLERLHVIGQRYVHTHLAPLARRQRANDQHGTLLQMWLDRDVKGVTKATQVHIRSTIDDLRRQLTRESGE